MESVIGLAKIAVYLGVAFVGVMVVLVIWYYFHARKLDAAAAEQAVAGADAGSHS